MSYNGARFGHQKAFAVSKIIESTFGTQLMTNSTRFYVPADMQMPRITQNEITDREFANGQEFMVDKIPLEINSSWQTGDMWASPAMIGRTLGFGLGGDTVGGVGAAAEHVFDPKATSGLIGGFSFAATADYNGNPASARQYAGNQIRSFTVTIGGSGYAKASWDVWLGDDVGSENITSQHSYEDTDLLTPNAKVSVIIAEAGTEQTTTWDGAFTQPTTGGAPSGHNLGGGAVDISSLVKSLTLTWNNNFDESMVFGPGAANGAGVNRGQAQSGQFRTLTGTLEMITGSSEVEGIIDGLFTQTFADTAEFTLQVLASSDTDLGSSQFAGWSIVVPLADPKQDYGVTGGVGPQTLSLPFEAKQDTGGNSAFTGAVWDGTGAIFAEA